MNPLSTLRARRLARPHLLALAAVLALPVSATAATNNWLCERGEWTSANVCWSLGRLGVGIDDVVIAAGPAGSAMRLLTVSGNLVEARSITLGTSGTQPSFSTTAQLYASNANIVVQSDSIVGRPSVEVGPGLNANAALLLTNRSVLYLPRDGRNYVALGSALSVPSTAVAGTQLGFGTLSVLGDSRVDGNVAVYNGLLSVLGTGGPGYQAVGQVTLGGGASSDARAVANIAGGARTISANSGGSASLGTTSAGLSTPDFGSLRALAGGTIDFVGRSTMSGPLTLRGGLATVKGGADVGNSTGSASALIESGSLVVESGGRLSTGAVTNSGSVALQGGNLSHKGLQNAGTLRGSGRVVGLAGAAFTHQWNGTLLASGGDLTIDGRFDGSAGGAIGTQNGRLFFYGDALFYAGQVISGTGGTVGFGFGKVEIGSNPMRRGLLAAVSADFALLSTSNLILDFGITGLNVVDHDYLSTAGKLQLAGGKLTLSTAGSFQAGLGSFYNVFRATRGITGTFSSIDTTAFALTPGARLDMSNLYTTGTLAVVAVPEPATWLSLGAGLLLIGARARRWRQEA